MRTFRVVVLAGVVAAIAAVAVPASADAAETTETLQGRIAELDAIRSDAVAHLRIQVRVPRRGQALGGSTEVRVHADGFGDSSEMGAGVAAVLPATGGSVPLELVAVGGALVAGAVVLMLAARRGKGGEDG